MPEGDTIRRLATKIAQRFVGERCVRCVTRDPRLVGVDLSGAAVVDVDAIGKHLLIRFDNGTTLHSHLLMNGSWTVGLTRTRARMAAAHRTVDGNRAVDRRRPSGGRTVGDGARGPLRRSSRPRPLRARGAGHRRSRRSSAASTRTRRWRPRCSISATSPASGTSTRSKCRSSPPFPRTSRWERSRGWNTSSASAPP